MGELQLQILSYLLQSGLRYFKPSMLPVQGSRKEVAEAVARLMRHRLVARVRHGYYVADLDLIKQVSLQKRLQFPPVSQAREFPPVSRLVPPGSPRGPQPAQPARRAPSPASQQARRAPTQPTSAAPSPTQQPTGTTPSPAQRPSAAQPTAAPTPAPSPTGTVQQPCSAVCNDRKLSRYVKPCPRRTGVIIPAEPIVQEILYDNVRALSPGGYIYGDKNRLLRAEDLVRFDRIDYAELSVATYSDFFEDMGVVKIYFKCVHVNGYGHVCSDFVEWMPPQNFIARHGIPYANYTFRKYIIPAAQQVLHRARQVLARRYRHPCN